MGFFSSLLELFRRFGFKAVTLAILSQALSFETLLVLSLACFAGLSPVMPKFVKHRNISIPSIIFLVEVRC